MNMIECDECDGFMICESLYSSAYRTVINISKTLLRIAAQDEITLFNKSIVNVKHLFGLKEGMWRNALEAAKSNGYKYRHPE
jgi:hypothetical protein